MSHPPQDPDHAAADDSDDTDAAATDPSSPALSFGGVADAYERGRPGYPTDAARWLIGEGPLSVLELGAGTGKLTEQLVALGHDVHATDPDPEMPTRLSLKLPEARISQGGAEEIAAGDATYDVVVTAQAYHWFDHERALPEIARVLKRNGHFAVVWNVRDDRIPWVKRLGRLIGMQDGLSVLGDLPGQSLEVSPYFGTIEGRDFKHWQVVDRSSIRDLTLSRSSIATLEPSAREARLREVVEFYDDYGRGMDGMQLPYLTRCFRVGTGIRPPSRPAPAAEDPEHTAERATTGDDPQGGATADGEPDATAERPPIDPPTDDDSGVLLIDFR